MSHIASALHRFARTAWRILSVLVISAAVLAAAAVTSADPLVRGPVPQGKLLDASASHSRTDLVVVKFAEGTDVRLRGGRLTSLRGATDVTAVSSWLEAHPGVTVARRFVRSEADLDRSRVEGRQGSGIDLADLNLYYEFRLPSAGPAEAEAAVSEIRSLASVELAYLEPKAELATAGVVEVASAPAAATTPDYVAQQGYLGASPSGINAQAVWGFPGGRGAGVKIIDIEGAWLWTHEDLSSPFFQGGTPIPDLGWRNHGTAVLGEMVGVANAYGVTGIASDMQAGGCSIGDLSVAAAIDLASANLAPGDLFLIELHAAGPNSTGQGQFGFLPMEFWQDNFDAIQTAVANGRICIEAGGNGYQYLDDPVYQGLFDRNVRNSGAIMVGAGTPTGNSGESYTNHGNRIDLNGWGSSVTTCGYGNLQGGAETVWYTSTFSGTSSASPIVAGAVACLQGMSKAHWGITLNASLAAEILRLTGTPYIGSKRIGSRPDLAAARTMLLEGIGVIQGTVRDQATSAPIANADVLILEPNVLVRTDATGQYTTTVRSGTFTLRASDFFHTATDEVVTVDAGQTAARDIALPRKPTGDLAGTVMTQLGDPVAGARVELLGVPIPAVTASAQGAFTIGGIPAGASYETVYGLVPGLGAAGRVVTIAAGSTTTANAVLVPAETFEGSGAGYASSGLWEWGMPVVTGPSSAFSGMRLWGTDLNSSYPDDVSSTLTSGSFDFAGATALYLSFAHWYDIEAGFDGGQVQVWSDPAWVTVEPFGGYPLDFLAGLAYGSGYSGISDGWRPAVFDLTPHISADVRVRFLFGSDAGVTAPGWYIDDVAFDVQTGSVGVGPDAAAPPAGLVAASPNPFADGTSLAFTLPASASVSLRVFDASGRLVREVAAARLEAGAHAVRWDGRDASGRAAASGTYFATLVAGGRAVGTTRLMLVR